MRFQLDEGLGRSWARRHLAVAALAIALPGAWSCSRGPGTIPLAPTYGVRVKVDTAWYDVAGSSVAEWLPSMRDGAMSSGVQPPYYSQTDWELRWAYSLPRRDRDACTLTLPLVSLQVRFVMPRLAAGITPADSDARAWARFTAALWEHERGHGTIAMRAAIDGADNLRHFRGLSCAGLSMQVDELMQSVMERWLDEERRYDERNKPVVMQAGAPPV